MLVGWLVGCDVVGCLELLWEVGCGLGLRDVVKLEVFVLLLLSAYYTLILRSVSGVGCLLYTSDAADE